MAIYLFVLLSLAACYLVGAAACRLRPLDYPYGAPSRLGHIDGLRGYLALLVFTMHFATTRQLNLEGYWANAPQHGLKVIGDIGVALFFMVTGYLFTYRLLSTAGRVDWRGLYISRIFRIYPVYLLFVAIVFFMAFVISGFVVNDGIGEWLNSLMGWLAFNRPQVNGVSSANLVPVGVQWTLRYEGFFYLSLPLLALVLRSRIASGILAAIVVAGGVYPLYIYGFGTLFLVFFLAGGIAAALRHRNPGWIRHIDRAPVTLAAILAMAVTIVFFDTAYEIIPAALLSVFFIPVALGNSLFGLLKLRGSEWLGEISFSIYLLHTPVLFYVFSLIWPNFAANHSELAFDALMPVIAIVVTLLAGLTYTFIEKPMIDVGKRLRKREPAPPAAVPAALPGEQ